MKAGAASTLSVTRRRWTAAGAGLALAAGLSAAAHAAELAAAAGALDAISGVFVGPDGLHIGPVVAAGVVAGLLVISIIARLARKPAPAAARAASPAPAARVAPSRPQPSARPEPQRVPAASAPTSKAAKAAAPTSKVASTSNTTAEKAKPLLRVIRKLPPELDLKHRDPATKTGAVAPAVKLISERRGVIAHVEKMKLTDESDLAKRRPTSFQRGRRIA